MSVYVRTCPSDNKFNTGGSYCPIEPGKVKAIILATVDLAMPFSVTADKVKELCHEDRPNRIYPLKNVVEYAPSGGEAQTSETGYGGTKIIGYSAKVDAFTMGNYDSEIVKSLTKIKNSKLYVFYVDSEGQVHGIKKDGDNENLYGIPAIVYVTDQSFDTSSTEANYIVNVALEDVERYMLRRFAFQPAFDIYDALMGLISVSWVTLESGKYQLVDSTMTNISGVYRELATTDFEESPSAVSYDAATNSFTITGGGSTPKLVSAKQLYANEIYGIEQV